jgi:ABC-type glycerol-3-phosphate transport system substrate-binding protein
MMRGKLSKIIVVSLLTTWLAACQSGGGAVPPDSTAKGGEEGGAALAKKVSETPTELVFYTGINGWTEETFMENYGNLIQKKFPNYKLKFIPQTSGNKDLQAAITSGQTIDILISSIGLTSTFLLAFDMQYDISELIKKYDYKLDRLEPSTVEIQRQLANGGIYGLPANTTSAALFYNKDLFDRFGVSYPKEGMTWDELYDLARRMTRQEEGKQYKGFLMSFQHLMLLNQLSASHVDPKTNKSLFTSEPFTKAFTNLSRFYTIPGNGLPNPQKYTMADQQDLFYKDKSLAMYAALSTTSSTFKDQVNWDVIQLPYHKELMGVGPQSYPNYFYISAGSKNKDAAFQVLDYVTSNEFQEFFVKRGSPSILKDKSKLDALFASEVPYLKGKNVKSLLPEKFAAPTVKTVHQAAADKELLTALTEWINGKDVNNALREASERLDKAIEAANK